MRAAGFVLTGGNSTRMGRDKALLAVGDDHLVHAIATNLRMVADSVTLIGEPERYADLSWPCLPDLRTGLGPLAGLEAALTNTNTELNLVVACDMPGLRTDWLTALLTCAAESKARCVVTRDPEGRVHPLCAVYRVDCLPIIQQALDDRRLKLTRIVEEMGAKYLQSETTLDNVNTPLDWVQWQGTCAQAR